MTASGRSLEATRVELDELDAQIETLVARRDHIVASLIRSKEGAPYDARREQAIARENEALWLPLLRRVRTAEGARLVPFTPKPAAFPVDRFLVVAGPCSIDEQLEPTLEAVHTLGLRWVRAGAWKPRTFPWSFQGDGLAGLVRLRSVADRLDLKVVCEVVSEADAPRAAELVDVIQVGARNAHNYALLKALSRLGKPVLLKRGAASTIEEWLGAAAYLDGQVPLTLCERGVRSFDPCLRNLLDLAGATLARRLGGFQTFVDPSHGTGVAGLVAPMVLATRAAGLDGALIEVHAAPEQSRSDADQALRIEELSALLSSLRTKAGDE